MLKDHTIQLPERYELIDTPVTIDGRPAKISGALSNFPTVGLLEKPHTLYVWSWYSIKKIVETKNGAFNS